MCPDGRDQYTPAQPPQNPQHDIYAMVAAQLRKEQRRERVRLAFVVLALAIALLVMR